MQIKNRGHLPKLLDFFNLPSRGAELGVAEGRFSKELLDNGLAILYLVDIWEEVPFIDGCASFDNEWHENNYKKVLEQFERDERVAIFKGFSHHVAKSVKDDSLGLVYVDSDHSYQGVKAEIKVWWPKLVSGGIMAFHDYGNDDYGVKRAVIEHMKGEAGINIIEEDGNPVNIGAWIRKV